MGVKTSNSSIDDFFNGIPCALRKDIVRPATMKDLSRWVILCSKTADLKGEPSCPYLDMTKSSKAILNTSPEGYSTHLFYACRAREAFLDVLKESNPALNYHVPA